MPRALSLRPISRSSLTSSLIRRPLFIITSVRVGPVVAGSGAGTKTGSGSPRVSVGGPWPSDIVVSLWRAGTKLAPHSAQKIVPSNCFALQLLQICMVRCPLSVVRGPSSIVCPQYYGQQTTDNEQPNQVPPPRLPL